MKTEIAFEIRLQDHSVHQLFLEDIKAIQALYEQCLDYMLLVDGHPATPNGVEEDFLSLPAGRSREDKFVFGIANQQKEIVGLLDTVRGYPNDTTWWIGVLLFVPESRSRGLGEIVLRGFVEYARLSGAQAIMLGVVEDNIRAYKFWNSMGFEFVRDTEPRQFGDKTQTVKVMQRIL
jgi:ribosomal protein S18 acetylase RimI-like enzyme